MILVVYVVCCSTIILAFIFCPPFKKLLVDLMVSFEHYHKIYQYGILVLIGNITVIFGLPLSLFEILLGYTCKSLEMAIVIDMLVNLTSFVVCYNLARHCLRS